MGIGLNILCVLLCLMVIGNISSFFSSSSSSSSSCTKHYVGVKIAEQSKDSFLYDEDKSKYYGHYGKTNPNNRVDGKFLVEFSDGKNIWFTLSEIETFYRY